MRFTQVLDGQLEPSIALPHYLTIGLFEMAFIQIRPIPLQLKEKIRKTLSSRKLVVAPEDGSKHIKHIDRKMTFNDELLLNSMIMSLYASFGDSQTVSDIARWVFGQIETHPHYDTILDAVFHTEVWLQADRVFRKKIDNKKLVITIDVTADNGEKKQFKIDSINMDKTQ